MERYHARPPEQMGSSPARYISHEEITARANAATLRTSSSSSSSSAAQVTDIAEESLGRGKRKKRPISRFTPEARKVRPAGNSSCCSSSSVTPAAKKRSIHVERRLDLDSSEDIPPADESRTVYRCPFEDCPEGSAAARGWLQRPALIAHLNAVHLSSPGVSLPEAFAHTVNLCPRCQLIVNSRGCPSCQGKSGRASNQPLAQMEVDAALQPAPQRESVPGLLEILTTKVSVMQHVPKGFRIEWCDLLADEINNFCDEQTMDALALLMLLPKVILLSADRGGRSAKKQVLNVCRGRAKAWKEQTWSALWSLSLKKKLKAERRTRTEQKTAKLRQRIRRVMADKGTSKAAKELVSNGVHEVDDEIMEKLRNLHPHEEPYIHDGEEDAACVWPGLTEEDDNLMRDVVRQFSEASGGGPSQLLPIHLKEAVSCGSDITELKLVRALRRFVDLCASGVLPTQLSEFMTAANLIPLKKKSGPKDVRPIACGEVLRRVVEQVILRKYLPAVKSYLDPEQVGVGIKDAATQTAIACSQLLPKIAQEPQKGLLQIDLKNAFNSVLRAAVLRQVQQRAPAMFPWAKWSLGGKNLLVCQEETIHGVRGVQQGSPLGPLFFSLALQEVLIELRPLFDEASWKIWYLDDGTIFGNLELLEVVLARLEANLPRIGLELNLSKCVLVSACPRADLNRFPHLAEVSLADIRDENNGFKVLGVPMGGSAYVKKALEEISEKVEQFCDQLITLDHPQMGFVLLRQCCGTCRVVHLLRAMDTKETAQLAEAVDATVMNSALAMLRAPCAENARTQLTLPLRYGGCGLARATDIASLAAFTGRWSFQEQGFQVVHLPKALISDSRDSLLRFLHDATQGLPAQFLLPRAWLAEKRLPEKVDADWLKLDYWCEKMHQCRWENLLSQCSGRDLVRLLCQHTPSIGAWLSAIPSCALGTEISPPLYRILLRWWLGLSVASSSADAVVQPKCPFCDDAMDAFGDHLLCCNKAEFYTRHQVVVKCLTMFVAAADVRATNEVQIEGRERPADIFLDRWTTSDPVAVDVTVTHPLAPSLGLNVRLAKEAAAAKE